VVNRGVWRAGGEERSFIIMKKQGPMFNTPWHTMTGAGFVNYRIIRQRSDCSESELKLNEGNQANGKEDSPRPATAYLVEQAQQDPL